MSDNEQTSVELTEEEQAQLAELDEQLAKANDRVIAAAESLL